jgi:hypothetical protein
MNQQARRYPFAFFGPNGCNPCNPGRPDEVTSQDPIPGQNGWLAT